MFTYRGHGENFNPSTLDTLEHHFNMSGSYQIPATTYPRREKTVGESWNQTQVIFFGEQPHYPLDHVS